MLNPYLIATRDNGSQQPPRTRASRTRFESSPVVRASYIAAAIGPWRSRSGPLYHALAGAIGSLIHQGVLSADERLPGERVLAAELNVGRSTVVAAYSALRSERLLHTTRGSGSVVRSGLMRHSTAHAAHLSRLLTPVDSSIDLTVGAPTLLPDLSSLTAALVQFAPRLPPNGFAPLGLPELRFALAKRLTEAGVRTTPSQILVTTGAQGARSLISDAFIARGDLVAAEVPTSPGALEAFTRAGARLTALDRDQGGLMLEPLRELMDNNSVRLLSLASTLATSSGASTSPTRAHQLAYLLRDSRTTVVDDGTAAEMWFSEPALGLLTRCPNRIIYVGTFRRSLWSGFRTAWLRASEEVVLRLGRLATGRDLGPSAIEQALILTAMPLLDELLAARRQLAQRRAHLLYTELQRQLPEWEVTPPRGGWHLWVRLPRGDGDRFAHLALRRGVTVAPGSATALDSRFARHLVISYASSEAKLRSGVRILAAAWREYCA